MISSALVSPSPLWKCCLKYFMRNMDSLTDQHLKDALALLPTGEMNCLFSGQLNDAYDIDSLRRTVRFIRLFGSKMSRIKISLKKCPAYNFRDELETVSTELLAALSQHLSCSAVRYLHIHEHPLTLHMDDLLCLFSRLHRLTVIRLFVRHLDDRIVRVIGDTCKELQELHLLGTNFTHNGLMWLAPEPSINHSGCPLLTHLAFYPTGNKIGFTAQNLAYLLTRCKAIRQFEAKNEAAVVANVALLEMMTFERTPHWPIRMGLSNVEIDFTSRSLLDALKLHEDAIRCFLQTGTTSSTVSEDIRFAYLRAIACMLPQLRQLKLTIASPSDLAILQFFTLFPQLTSLDLTMQIHEDDPQPGDPFEQLHMAISETNLRQVFLSLGQLHSLELMNFASVDLAVLARSCPLMDNLTISNVKRLLYKWSSGERPRFTKLRRVVVCGHSDYTLDSQPLLHLLADSNIHTLILAWCSQVSDLFMKELLGRNPLLALTAMEFHELSDEFTIAAVQNLAMTRQIGLQLSVSQCSGISREDLTELCAELHRRNRNVDFNYF